MSETSYGLIEPFDCDDPQFCLGVEWEMFRQKLLAGSPFTEMVHRDNAERLAAMCDRHNRFAEVQPCPVVEGFDEKHFDDWRTIVVGGIKS